MKRKSLSTLKKEAQRSTHFRGHHMHWVNLSLAPDVWWGECKVCGRYVIVRANPQPNEIDIGGEAVAENCIGRG